MDEDRSDVTYLLSLFVFLKEWAETTGAGQIWKNGNQFPGSPMHFTLLLYVVYVINGFNNEFNRMDHED